MSAYTHTDSKDDIIADSIYFYILDTNYLSCVTKSFQV